MHIKDLTQFPAGHPPSPYNFPIQLQKGNKWGEVHLQHGLTLIAIGWLGDFIPNQGATSSKCISRLWEAYETELFISDGTAGWHDCELCHGEDQWYPGGKVGPISEWQGQSQRIYGHGHFLIQYNESVYLPPVLILHYILEHEYKPPGMFIEAVEEGKFLTQKNLVWIENDS